MSTSPRRLSRRSLLHAAAAGGSGLLAAYLVGCADAKPKQPTSTPTRPVTPPPGATGTATAASEAGLRWTRLSPSLGGPPRRDHSLVSDGDLLWVFGGRSSQGDTYVDVWSLDPAAVVAQMAPTAAEAPPARFGHNAAFDPERRRMLVFGGQAGGTFFNDVWFFDVAAARWAPLAPGDANPSPRYGAAAASDPAGRLLVSHGFTDAGRFDDTWGFDLDGEAWTDVSPAGERPIERCLMRAVWDSVGGRFLMFGGQTTGEPFLGDLWELTRDGWRELTGEPKPSPRNFYAMAFDAEASRLILFGGNTAGGPTSDVWFFDSATDTWSQQSPEGEAPSPRYGHDGVWMEARRSLLVYGGNDGSQELNDLWELSLPA